MSTRRSKFQQKSRSKTVRTRRSGRATTSNPLPVIIRDPLSQENAGNYGDLKQVPPMFRQPRLANAVYPFVRKITSADVSQVAAADTFMTYRFELNDVSDTADFTDLFDQYRFRAVRIEFRPRFNFSNPGVVTANRLPRFYSVIDYDDNNMPTLINQLREYQSIKETRWDQDHVRLIKPRMATAALDNTGLTSLANEPAKWIDLAYLTVAHYGIKIAIEGGVGGQTNLQSWSVDLEYMIEFRQVR